MIKISDEWHPHDTNACVTEDLGWYRYDAKIFVETTNVSKILIRFPQCNR